MTRNLFIGDVVLLPGASGQAPILGSNLPFTVWSADVGGVRYTDLTARDGTSALTLLVTNSNGLLPVFRGPDSVEALFIDTGAPQRFPLFAVDELGYVLNQFRTTDGTASVARSTAEGAQQNAQTAASSAAAAQSLAQSSATAAQAAQTSANQAATSAAQSSAQVQQYIAAGGAPSGGGGLGIPAANLVVQIPASSPTRTLADGSAVPAGAMVLVIGAGAIGPTWVIDGTDVCLLTA